MYREIQLTTLLSFITFILSFNLYGPINHKSQALKLIPPNQEYYSTNMSSNDCQLLKSERHPFLVEMNKNAYHIPKGQCVEWADGRYYQLTGHHAIFNGDAHQWAQLAKNTKGWRVSDKPIVPSIIVIPRFVDGAQGFGHVAVVEGIRGKEICTSNWNFPELGKLSLRWMEPSNQVKYISYVG